MVTVTTWADFSEAEPDLAARTQERFETHGLALMATLRADGSPRISGVEPLIALGELWLAMMPGSRKSTDLRQDPRLALHNATIDKSVHDGDVKVSARAIAASDPDAVDRFRDEFDRRTGAPPPPGPFDLWRLDLTEVSMLRPEADHLVIEIWRPGRPVRQVERR
jgi:hypothetical protein